MIEYTVSELIAAAKVSSGISLRGYAELDDAEYRAWLSFGRKQDQFHGITTEISNDTSMPE